MAAITTALTCDLKKAVHVEYLKGNLFSLDNGGNVIQVTILSNGAATSVSGSVSANIIRADGATVTVTGTLSGNVASVTLPQAAYAVPGSAVIIVKLTSSGVVTTIAAIVCTVYRSSTDTAVDPGTIITGIDALIAQIQEAQDDLAAAIAQIPVDYSQLQAFFHFTKNMIDPSLCVDGELVNQASGAFQESSAQKRTGYIAVNPSTTYVLRAQEGSRGFRYAFYNNSHTYITGAILASDNNMLITSPANAAYIAISDTMLAVTWMLAPYVNSDTSFEFFADSYLKPEYVRPDMTDTLLNVPSKFYALQGYETNIYFENLTEDWTKYHWDVTSNYGQQLARGYRITPTAANVGNRSISIKAYIDESVYQEVASTLVITGSSAGSGTTKTVLILGDSTTDNGTVIQKLVQNFSDDVMNITPVGTRGTSPYLHEGRSGWSFNSYFTQASDGAGRQNPFYNPSTHTFDAAYYFANSGVSAPDWFIINLGINDVFGVATDALLATAMNTILPRYDTMISSVLSAAPSTKVGACVTIPPNHSQYPFGLDYGCRQHRDRTKRNNTIFANALISRYQDRTGEGIYLIPIHAALDTVYNMGRQEVVVNARSSVTEYVPTANGSVHPTEGGYWQIADVYTAFLKAYA